MCHISKFWGMQSSTIFYFLNMVMLVAWVEYAFELFSDKKKLLILFIPHAWLISKMRLKCSFFVLVRKKCWSLCNKDNINELESDNERPLIFVFNDRIISLHIYHDKLTRYRYQLKSYPIHIQNTHEVRIGNIQWLIGSWF